MLIQLPKKEAGAGLAFGGGATDALFGAGSGNVLTKITKYAATLFFVLAVVLSVMQSYYHSRTTSAFQRGLMQASPPAGIPTTPPTTPSSPLAATNSSAVHGTNAVNVTPPSVENTNLPLAIPLTPAPATNK